MTGTDSAARAKWQVTWVAKGNRFEEDFLDDLNGALALRDKLVAAGRKDVTLRSKNVAWPPPEEYRPHVVTKKILKGTRIVRRKGKRYRKKIYKEVDVEVHKMKQANAIGWWWCPYCVKFRKFDKCDGFEHDGIWVPQPGMYCPACGISHFDFAVRRHNPQANLLTYRRARQSKTKTRRKRGRRK